MNTITMQYQYTSQRRTTMSTAIGIEIVNGQPQNIYDDTPATFTYYKNGQNSYEVPQIIYPDGTSATIYRNPRTRTWHAEINPEQHHYTRAAAAHAEYQRARAQHRRAQELQLTARKIRDAAENYAQSRTEHRHAHEPYVAAIYAQSADLNECRGIANYWQSVSYEEGKLLAEIREIAGIHRHRIDRLFLLAEARYVQQHYPEDYKKIEAKATPWRQHA